MCGFLRKVVLSLERFGLPGHVAVSGDISACHTWAWGSKGCAPGTKWGTDWDGLCIGTEWTASTPVRNGLAPNAAGTEAKKLSFRLREPFHPGCFILPRGWATGKARCAQVHLAVSIRPLVPSTARGPSVYSVTCGCEHETYSLKVRRRICAFAMPPSSVIGLTNSYKVPSLCWIRRLTTLSGARSPGGTLEVSSEQTSRQMPLPGWQCGGKEKEPAGSMRWAVFVSQGRCNQQLWARWLKTPETHSLMGCRPEAGIQVSAGSRTDPSCSWHLKPWTPRLKTHPWGLQLTGLPLLPLFPSVAVTVGTVPLVPHGVCLLQPRTVTYCLHFPST